jgi:hypothetical protein
MPGVDLLLNIRRLAASRGAWNSGGCPGGNSLTSEAWRATWTATGAEPEPMQRAGVACRSPCSRNPLVNCPAKAVQ